MSATPPAAEAITAANTVRAALNPKTTERSILVSVRNTFPNPWYTFFNPSDPTATAQALTLPLTETVFPFANLGTPKITGTQLVFALAPDLASKMSGMSISGNYQPATASSETAVAFTPVPATMEDGVTPVTALTGTLTLPGPPGAFTVTVPLSGVNGPLTTTVAGQARLDPTLFEDIFLVVTYVLG